MRWEGGRLDLEAGEVCPRKVGGKAVPCTEGSYISKWPSCGWWAQQREVGSAPRASRAQKTSRSVGLAGALTTSFAVSAAGGVTPRFLET